jgi:predicted peptidase
MSGMTRLLLLPLLLMTLPSLPAAPDPTPFATATFEDKLPYRLASPTVEKGKRYPLVLFLHGRGESGTDNARQLKHGAPAFVTPAFAAAHPAFILAPQCPNDSYWGGVTLDRVIRLVRHVMATQPVDPDRVYITGLSMGGYGTWEALARHAGLWTAAIPICGGGNPLSTIEIGKVPVWAFHGAADPVVPVTATRAMVERLKKAGGTVKYTEYPGVEHDSWTQTYADPEVLEWLFAQRK